MNRIIIATPNKSARTYTLRVKYDNGTQVKYRTHRQSKEEFQSMSHHTQNDWNYYLRSTEDYYQIKK